MSFGDIMEKKETLLRFLKSEKTVNEYMAMLKLAIDIPNAINFRSEIESSVPVYAAVFGVCFLDVIEDLLVNIKTFSMLAEEVLLEEESLSSESDDDFFGPDGDFRLSDHHIKKIRKNLLSSKSINEDNLEEKEREVLDLIKKRITQSKNRDSRVSRTPRVNKGFVTSDLKEILEFMNDNFEKQEAWYTQFLKFMNEMFFDSIENKELADRVRNVFFDIVASTSISASIKKNLNHTVYVLNNFIDEDGNPLRDPDSFGEMDGDSVSFKNFDMGSLGEIFKGVGMMAGVKRQIITSLAEQGVSGPKIGQYAKNMKGLGGELDTTIDRHMLELFFSNQTASPRRMSIPQDRLRYLSENLSKKINKIVTPQEAQASLWMFRCLFETNRDVGYHYIDYLSESKELQGKVRSGISNLSNFLMKRSRLVGQARAILSEIEIEERLEVGLKEDRLLPEEELVFEEHNIDSEPEALEFEEEDGGIIEEYVEDEGDTPEDK